jgi:membrane-bound metal-dependent hydrolase YbcI (DUF457 family)
MPFTPFHFGPALFIGLLLFSLFDLPTLMVSSVVVDLEPFFVLRLRLNYPLHGFFHSYLGGTILALVVAVAMFILRDFTESIMRVFKLQQKSSFKKILVTSLLGVYSHIFLDSFLYEEMKPFYPLEFNPFPSVLYAPYTVIYGFCSVSFIFGLVLYAYRMRTSS